MGRVLMGRVLRGMLLGNASRPLSQHPLRIPWSLFVHPRVTLCASERHPLCILVSGDTHQDTHRAHTAHVWRHTPSSSPSRPPVGFVHVLAPGPGLPPPQPIPANVFGSRACMLAFSVLCHVKLATDCPPLLNLPLLLHLPLPPTAFARQACHRLPTTVAPLLHLYMQLHRLEPP